MTPIPWPAPVRQNAGGPREIELNVTARRSRRGLGPRPRYVSLLVCVAVVALVGAACTSAATTSPVAPPTAAPPSVPASQATAGSAAPTDSTAAASNASPESSPSVGPSPACVPPGASGASSCPSLPTAFERNIPFTPPGNCGGGTQCQLQLDVYHPTQATPGGPWPVVLAIPGGPAPLGVRAGLSGLALGLAAQGTVVFTADYRSMPAQDAGFPQTFEDVACAVRTARAMAAQYGGNPARVTLVANSLGGWPGAVIAFSTQPFPLDATNCLAQAGSSRPDAFVGVAGVYTLDKIDPGYLDAFFGGTRQTAPGAWAAGDPYAIVNANRNGPIPVTLVGGTRDQTVPLDSTQLFTGYLRIAGYTAQLTIVPGATHDSVLAAPQTVASVLAAVR